MLLVLHVYWFSLIVRVAYAALAKKSEVSWKDWWHNGESFLLCRQGHKVMKILYAQFGLMLKFILLINVKNANNCWHFNI